MIGARSITLDHAKPVEPQTNRAEKIVHCVFDLQRTATRTDHMKMKSRWNRFASCTLFLCLTWTFCLRSIDNRWAQDKTGGPTGGYAQVEGMLDLRGDVPNPRQIDASELRKLPRAETRTTDPHNPGKKIVYSGTSLVEVLKASGLQLDSGTAG